MPNRFPPLRSQDQMMKVSRPSARALPAPVDLTFLAALAFVVAFALV